MAQAAAAKVIPFIRRFDTADFSVHGNWVVPRMLQAFPHMNERGIATFLQNIIYNNEYQFLYSDEGVALAQVQSATPLDPRVVVTEKFVWVKDSQDKDMQVRAAEFYAHIRRWAESLSAQVIIVEENSDVTHDAIKEKLGRIFTRQQQFARV